MQVFEDFKSGEKNVLTFNYGPGLANGNTLTGTIVVEVTTVLGDDADPQAIINGVPQFDVSETMVLVPVAPTLPGVRYKILVTALTESPVIELKLPGLLIVC